mgnify:CR=1 FL=1
MFFLAIIYLVLCCSKPKTRLCIGIARLTRLASGTPRPLLTAPNACRCAYLVAESAMTQRLSLRQGEPDVAQGCFVQLAAEQGSVGSLSVGSIAVQREVPDRLPRS